MYSQISLQHCSIHQFRVTGATLKLTVDLLAAATPSSADMKYRAHVCGSRNDAMNPLQYR